MDKTAKHQKAVRAAGPEPYKQLPAAQAKMIHTVRQGECIARIAAAHGFSKWQYVYGHPNNTELRRQRPDPNLLHPGDLVFIPPKESKSVTCATGRSHQFVVRRPTKKLRLVVMDFGDAPIRNAAYVFAVGGMESTGFTDGSGKIDIDIPVETENGRLTVGDKTWSLAIGHLNPVDHTPDEGATGIQARLRNLGYDVGPIDGLLASRTRAAILAFQREHRPLKIDGICGPKTRAKLIEVHGC